MPRALVTPPAIHAPAPRQPSFGSSAAKAQARQPGCQNPNGRATWRFAGAGLRILDVPETRFRSHEEEVAARGTASGRAPEIMDLRPPKRPRKA